MTRLRVPGPPKRVHYMWYTTPLRVPGPPQDPSTRTHGLKDVGQHCVYVRTNVSLECPNAPPPPTATTLRRERCVHRHDAFVQKIFHNTHFSYNVVSVFFPKAPPCSSLGRLCRFSYAPLSSARAGTPVSSTTQSCTRHTWTTPALSGGALGLFHSLRSLRASDLKNTVGTDESERE